MGHNTMGEELLAILLVSLERHTISFGPGSPYLSDLLKLAKNSTKVSYLSARLQGPVSMP